MNTPLGLCDGSLVIRSGVLGVYEKELWEVREGRRGLFCNLYLGKEQAELFYRVRVKGV